MYDLRKSKVTNLYEFAFFYKVTNLKVNFTLAFRTLSYRLYNAHSGK